MAVANQNIHVQVMATAASVHPWTSPVSVLNTLEPALTTQIPLNISLCDIDLLAGDGGWVTKNLNAIILAENSA